MLQHVPISTCNKFFTIEQFFVCWSICSLMKKYLYLIIQVNPYFVFITYTCTMSLLLQLYVSWSVNCHYSNNLFFSLSLSHYCRDLSVWDAQEASWSYHWWLSDCCQSSSSSLRTNVSNMSGLDEEYTDY